MHFGFGTYFTTPHWREATMWGKRTLPTIHNRGAVAHPEATTHDEDVEHIILSESLLNLQPLHG